MSRFLSLAILLLLALGSVPALAANDTIVVQNSLISCGAGADHISDNTGDACAAGAKLDFGLKKYASFTIVWSGLTGTINGVIKLQFCNSNCSNAANWIDKSGALVTLGGAAGNSSISLNGVVTEEYYRVNYAHIGVTGGTLDIQALGK